MPDHTILTKCCTGCQRKLPATSEFFAPLKRGKYGLYSKCRECKRAYDRERWNCAEVKARGSENAREWKSKNRGKVNAIWRKYYRTNPDKVQERQRRLGRAKQKRWRDKHPERNSRIRAQRRNAEGSHSAADIYNAYRAQRGLCWWCGAQLHDIYHVDHIIPLVAGGSNDARNICISCPHCNLSKGGKMPWEFNGRLL